MEDSPQKICHKEDSPHNECDQEFEHKRQTNVCNSADVEDSPHNNDRLGSGGGLGLGGLRLGSWVGGLGSEVGVGGVRVANLTPTPPTPTPRPNSPAQPLDFNPPNPNSPHRPQPITIVWQIFHIGTVANICPTLTLNFSVTFVRLTRCVANLLCGESSVANLPCGKSSGNPLTLTQCVSRLHDDVLGMSCLSL